MFEFTNVLDVSYGAYVVNSAYSGSSNSTSPAQTHNEAVAIIAELLRDNTADVRQSARDSSIAVNIIQTFSDALDTINAKLATMKELCQKASSPDYSQVKVEEMQKQFQNLAKQINETVEEAEYNYNKLFTATGKTISIPISNGSKVDLFARDFSFNAQGLNITTDPQNALSKVTEAIANVTEYRQYLNRQIARIEDVTAVIESEIESAMGVDLDDFKPDLALAAASYTASLISQDKSTSLNTQANLNPDETLQLLKI